MLPTVQACNDQFRTSELTVEMHGLKYIQLNVNFTICCWNKTRTTQYFITKSLSM